MAKFGGHFPVSTVFPLGATLMISLVSMVTFAAAGLGFGMVVYSLSMSSVLDPVSFAVCPFVCFSEVAAASMHFPDAAARRHFPVAAVALCIVPGLLLAVCNPERHEKELFETFLLEVLP